MSHVHDGDRTRYRPIPVAPVWPWDVVFQDGLRGLHPASSLSPGTYRKLTAPIVMLVVHTRTLVVHTRLCRLKIAFDDAGLENHLDCK